MSDSFQEGQKVIFAGKARFRLAKSETIHQVKSVRPVADPSDPDFDTIRRNAGHDQFVTIEDGHEYSGAHFELV